jgi:hypothetical protein
MQMEPDNDDVWVLNPNTQYWPGEPIAIPEGTPCVVWTVTANAPSKSEEV